MATYLLDTNILIEHLRGKRLIKDYLGDLQPGDSLCCSVITIAEIHTGVLPNEETLTKELLESLTQLPITKEIAEKAAALKKSLRHHGKSISLDDCFIAATAILHEATLVTLNKKHYPNLSHIIP